MVPVKNRHPTPRDDSRSIYPGPDRADLVSLDHSTSCPTRAFPSRIGRTPRPSGGRTARPRYVLRSTGYWAVKPPSIISTAPVKNWARSEARNT
jgi:hypothetical protein